MRNINPMVKQQLGLPTMLPDNKPVSLFPQTPSVVQGVQPTTPDGAQPTVSQVGTIPSPR